MARFQRYRGPPMHTHAMVPSARQLPHKTRLFLDFMQAEFAAIPLFRADATVDTGTP